MGETQEQVRSPGHWRTWHSEDAPIRLGVSSCLLGEEVRFDGGHKRNRFVTDVLGHWIEWVAVCPEVELGMGIPRPTIRLTEDEHGTHLVCPSTGEDFTQRMQHYAEERVAALEPLALDGYVLKKGSPSCGMERVPVYGGNGMPKPKQGVGLFAAVLMKAMPHLPVEEEGRLHDHKLRENFIERLFLHNRWRNLLREGLDRGRLVSFHTAHKLLLSSHNETGVRRLGRLLGDAGKVPDRELFAQYEAELYRTAKTRTTRSRHVNVLQHAMGHLKRLLGPVEKAHLLQAIDDYHRGYLPLIVPITLLRFNILRYEVDYLLGQLYFDPHPKELLLRNHV